MKRIPARWEKYLPMGCRVPGTRFLPFKVPLKPELCSSQPENERYYHEPDRRPRGSVYHARVGFYSMGRAINTAVNLTKNILRFTPSILMENTPMLKAVIDLTNTDRYYNSEEFTSKGVLYKKINIYGGGRLPPKNICEEFFNAVDQLCSTLDHDSDALIGVHCTHGLNRTGYLICKYMVLRMKIDPQEAINKFQEARGYHIERKNYLCDIMSQHSEPINWRTQPRMDLSKSAHRWSRHSRFSHTEKRRVSDRSRYNPLESRTFYK